MGQKRTPVIFIENRESKIRSYEGRGLTGMRYKFASVGNGMIITTSIEGNDIRLSPPNLLTDNTNGYATVFTYKNRSPSDEFGPLLAKIHSAQLSEEVIPIIKRTVTPLTSLDDLELLIAGKDVIRTEPRQNLALFNGMDTNYVQLLSRTAEGTSNEITLAYHTRSKLHLDGGSYLDLRMSLDNMQRYDSQEDADAFITFDEHLREVGL